MKRLRKTLMKDKVCNKCREIKSSNCFFARRGSPDGLHWTCKICFRGYNLRLRHGLSQEDYNAILEDQDFRCKICDSLPKRVPLAVDHDHVTGKIRGLLCIQCNTTLGRIEKHPQFLSRMQNYLSQSWDGGNHVKHDAVEVTGE